VRALPFAVVMRIGKWCATDVGRCQRVLGILFLAFVGCAAGESSVRSIIVAVVLALLELVMERVDVVDDLSFEEAVELLEVDVC
jgi:hypothetical protein